MKCCERDKDGDGNCDRHSAPGVLRMDAFIPMFYFGCWGSPGHFPFMKGGHHSREYANWPKSIWPRIDAGFCKRLPKSWDESSVKAEPQCGYTLTVIDGFTILAWWDRTGDSRPNSNSALIMQGEHSAETMFRVGRADFPEIFQRQAQFTFKPIE